MKKAALAALAAVLAIGLASCSATSYHYACIALDATPGRVLAEGEGNAAPCQALFGPPGAYVGPSIAIPSSAAVYGVLVVTRGERVAAVPLRCWTTADGTTRFGCNGPSPQFAHQGKTPEELAASIKRILAK